ncbi:MAG TPA: hypothetical protein VJB59_04355 [Bdellovibrionota bacterium]|nr:hypothetical protein [Bdellovibrionota bacterium]
MSRLKLLLLFQILPLCAFGASKNETSVGYRIKGETGGAVTLISTTQIPVAGLWLGVTLYSPSIQGTPGGVAMDPANSVVLVYPLKAGRAITEISVEPRFKNGTFEMAVWGRRIPKTGCAIDDEACHKLGYRLTEMKSYSWGYLTPL